MIDRKKTSILFVCMGNICRSPMAAAVARVEFARAGHDVEVDSAGTEAYHVGERADRRAIEVGEAGGYPMSDHRARQVEADDFERYDWILTMDRVNLAAIGRHRGRDARTQPALFLPYAGLDGVDEVPDPYFGSRRDFEHVLDLSRRGTELLIRKLEASRG